MIEVNKNPKHLTLCFCCNMPAVSEVRFTDLENNAHIKILCDACEYQLYTRLHESRQRKLSQHLSAITMHQSS